MQERIKLFHTIFINSIVRIVDENHTSLKK